MYDFIKLRIHDVDQIQRITSSSELDFIQQVNTNTGEVVKYPLIAECKSFIFKLKSSSRLEISGSLHKYWNGGSNENDFNYIDAHRTIISFCESFGLVPELAEVCNLEYGVNINPEIDASVLLNQIISFDGSSPSKPYDGKPYCEFIEFHKSEKYIKIYDKGKQYQTVNTLRFEVKAIKNRALAFANIKSLADLLQHSTMIALGENLIQACDKVVFTDDTIDESKLSTSDRINYLLMKDTKEWSGYSRKRTSTNRYRERRFKEIIQKFGMRKIHSTFKSLVSQKVEELISATLSNIPSNYKVKTNKAGLSSKTLKRLYIPRNSFSPINLSTPEGKYSIY